MNISDVLKRINMAPYTLVYEIHGSEVYIDSEKGILKIAWYWNINKETASKIIHFTCEKFIDGSVSKVLIDRRKLNKFDEHANDWGKNELIKSQGKYVIDLIDKVAVVDDKSAANNLISNFLAKGNHLISSKLITRKFSDIDKAEEWLCN